MGQQIELLASRLDDLILIPRSHMVEGTDFSELSCGLHMGITGLVPTKEINRYSNFQKYMEFRSSVVQHSPSTA